MILFFDTETSGLPDFSKRARDPSQPHMCQLAAMLTTDAGRVVESHNVLVRPEGWSIPIEATRIHGITNEMAQAAGIAEKTAARLLLDMVKKARLIVAHNLSFDKFIARIAMRRFDMLTEQNEQWWTELTGFCTMRETTDICQLEPIIRGKHKWPKLTEAYEFIFKKSFDNAHDALADVTACKEIYFWLAGRPAPIGRHDNAEASL